MTVDLAREFPQDDCLVYLNHAAVAPWPARTAAAVSAFARENVSRGATDYAAWTERETELRRQLAQLINARSADEIALAKNTSEALSFVANGISWSAGDNIVSSDEEFPSNRMVWEVLAPRGVELREVALRGSDGADPEARLEAACDARTRLIAVSSVQYASGLRLDVERLGRFCTRGHILLCLDAIQSLGALAFDVQACNADFVVADGHKWMLGPEGVALFYVRAERLGELRLSEHGWHMTSRPGDYDSRAWQPAPSARRFECGSPNMLGVHALSASLSLLMEVGIEAVEAAVLERSAHLITRFRDDPRYRLLTPARDRLRSGIVTVKPMERDAARLHAQLRARGVICAHRGGGLRFSPHFYTPMAKIERALGILDELVDASRPAG
jgi:selenocysteine lyase/cysteine desulfurase